MWVAAPIASRRASAACTLVRGRGDVEVEPGLAHALSIPDLLIAATAELAELTVLHLDKDFELIAAFTGQPLARLAVA